MASIITHPDERLRIVCAPVKSIDNKVKKDVKLLMQALEELGSPLRMLTGIASNQIGLSSRIIVLKNHKEGNVTMINPTVERRLIPSLSIELCASLPGKIRLKKRHLMTKVRFTDLENNSKTLTFLGSDSFIMQQELDHLDGKLIID